MWLLLFVACQTTTTSSARPAAQLPPPPPPTAPSRGGAETLPPTPVLPPPKPAPPAAKPPPEPPRPQPTVTPEPKDPFDEVEVKLTSALFAWKAGDEAPPALFDALRARMDLEETPLALDWAIARGWAQAELKGVLPAAGLWARAASRRVGATLLTWTGEGASGWSLYADGRLVAARVQDDAGTRSVGDLSRAGELLGVAAAALDTDGASVARTLGVDPDAPVQTHDLLEIPERRPRAQPAEPQVGQKVFVSPYGVGTLLGEAAAEGAWVVQVADIPRVKVPKPTVRPLVSRAEADAILARFEGFAAPLPLPWEARYRAFADRIRGGDAEEIADVLLWLKGSAAERAWTDSERKVADHAAKLLAAELAAVLEKPEDEVKARLV